MTTAHKSRVLDMTRGDPFRLLLQFSLPLFCSNLLQQVYNLTDTALAGHLLGSAFVEIVEQTDSGAKRVIFSGDLGKKGRPILRDIEYFTDATKSVDAVITESTYGDRLHQIYDKEETLAEIINDTMDRGGNLIIPSFAVGRTQELVYALHELTEAQKIPSLDIYVDSPLAVDVTEVFRAHPECYDEETLALLQQTRNPFGFRQLTYVRDVEDSKRLNFLRESAVIISASGMCESGRILHHLKNNIEDSDNTILFSGFQAENTLGRRILDGNRRVRIFGEEYDVRARVARIEGYSAHADSEELRAWTRHFDRQRLQHIFLVHGETDSALGLSGLLYKDGFVTIQVPERGQSFDL